MTSGMLAQYGHMNPDEGFDEGNRRDGDKDERPARVPCMNKYALP